MPQPQNSIRLFATVLLTGALLAPIGLAQNAPPPAAPPPPPRAMGPQGPVVIRRKSRRTGTSSSESWPRRRRTSHCLPATWLASKLGRDVHQRRQRRLGGDDRAYRSGAYRVHLPGGRREGDGPDSPAVSESNTNSWSLVYVPGADFMDAQQVPHGAVASVTYYSTALGRNRRMHIYTPPWL